MGKSGSLKEIRKGLGSQIALTCSPLIKIGFILLLSILIAYGFVHYLKYTYHTEVESINPLMSITVSSETAYFNHSTLVLPSYFQSISDVYVCFYSKYADVFNEVKMELSLNNKDWIKVPLQKRDLVPTSYNDFSLIGQVTVDKPTISIVFGRYLIPPQTLHLPSGVTKEVVSDSFFMRVRYRLDSTPRDQVLEILVNFTGFSVTFSILRFIVDEYCKKRPLKSRAQSTPLTG